MRIFFFAALTLAMASCKAPSSSDSLTSTETHQEESASEEEELVADHEEAMELAIPVSTEFLVAGFVIDSADLSTYIDNPMPGAVYTYLGYLPIPYEKELSAVIIQEEIGERKMMYLVCRGDRGFTKIFTTVIHHEERGKPRIMTVIGGAAAETINRLDLGKGVMEVHNLYTFNTKPGADAALPLLKESSGTVTAKEDMRSLITALQMEGRWDRVVEEEDVSAGRTSWAREPCGDPAWFGISPEAEEGEPAHPRYEQAGLFPILSFSLLDSEDWTIESISWSNYGNAVEIKARLAGPFVDEANPQTKTYAYTLLPDIGVRVFDERFALSSQAEPLLKKSEIPCPDDDGEEGY